MTGRLPRASVAVGIGLVVAAVVVAVLLLSGEDDSDGGGAEDAGSAPQATDVGSTLQATKRPEEASLDRLRELASLVGHPVYWAGEQPGRKYELTLERDGNVLIRYLPKGVPAGSRQFITLTIATYPFVDALAALRALAREPGAVSDRTPDGGFVVATAAGPNSAYVAFPDTDYQIEVYDPIPDKALEIATSGAIAPIE